MRRLRNCEDLLGKLDSEMHQLRSSFTLTLGFDLRSLPRMIGPLHVLPPIAAKQTSDILGSSNTSQSGVPPLCQTSPRLQGAGHAASMAALAVRESTEGRCQQVVADPEMIRSR